MATQVISGRGLTPGDVVRLSRGGVTVALDPEAGVAMDRAHTRAESASRRVPIYGRGTGVGSNRDVPADDPAHGERLLASHATTGTTAYPTEVVRAAVLVRVNQLARGGSGLPSAVADALVELHNRDELPVLHRGGALGIGDLGALAELGLALGAVLEGPDALAFLSSNAVTLAECCLVAARLRELLDVVPVVAALTLVAMGGDPGAFDVRVQTARPHDGQARVAARMRSLLDGVPMRSVHLQDPFGLRAFAQVLGPVVELLDDLERVLEVDLNAAGESPLVSGDAILHNGNWHTMPVVVRLDALRSATYGVAALSASRLSNLLDPELTGLSRFLAVGPASSSGAMMLEYVAQDGLAALRSEAGPATLGTVSMSHGVETHASFAPQSVAMAGRLLPALRTVLACELVAGSRAAVLAGRTTSDLRPARIASYVADAGSALPTDLADRPLRADIELATGLLARWGTTAP